MHADYFSENFRFLLTDVPINVPPTTTAAKDANSITLVVSPVFGDFLAFESPPVGVGLLGADTPNATGDPCWKVTVNDLPGPFASKCHALS